MLELIIVLAILSILVGVVGLALHSAPPANASDESTARVLAARDSAIRFGHAVTVKVTMKGAIRLATAFPDGRVVADPALGIDPLTGRPLYAPR
jgi:hypothetical protein